MKLFLFISVITLGSNFAIANNEYFADFRAKGYIVEGDMLLLPPSNATMRGSVGILRNWPKKTLPYKIRDDVPDNLKQLTVDAMEYIAKHSCLKFPKHTNQKYFLDVQMHPDLIKDPNLPLICAAVTGFNPDHPMIIDAKGGHAVLLGPRCTIMPLVHELLHTIGFYHEHSRVDRDEFIELHEKNMVPEGPGQFKKDDEHCRENYGDAANCTTYYFDLPYNYESIMHYCNTCGSKSTSCNVRTFRILKNPKAMGSWKKVGQANGLSEGDFLMLNRKYECDMSKVSKPDPLPEVVTTMNPDCKPYMCKRSI